MREILFKAKRKDNGEWVEGAYCPSSLDSLLGEMKPKPNIIKLGGEYDGFWFEVIPETVSQYTGLKDKNGKKIFEGDIVIPRYNGFSQFPVEYNNGAYNIARYSVSRCEVIGNIYD